MVKQLILRRQDLITNPAARIPVCLVLDCSPSMSGDTHRGASVQQNNPRPIDELNDGVELFFSEVKQDELAQYACEVAVVAFSEVAETVLDFDSIMRVDAPRMDLTLSSGGTSIGKAVKLALSLLDRRKEEYKDAGVDYFQPWMVLMTDGYPTDNTHLDVAVEVANRLKQKKLHVFPVGIGHGADMEVLAMFSQKIKPLKLQGLRFKEFFAWLSRSVAVVSQSMPGEKITFDAEGIKTWADLET